MKKLKFKDDPTQNLLKIGFFLVAALMIIESFPREGRFRYSFQEGKPWRYGLMTAPYDFQIYKSQAQVKHETDSILKEFRPCLNIDTTVYGKEMDKFASDYASNLKSIVPSRYFRFLSSKLRILYGYGIISSAEMDGLTKDSVSELLVVRGNIAEPRNIGSMLTATQAYDKIFRNLPPDIDPDVLRYCNPGNYITNNLSQNDLATKMAKEKLLGKISMTSGLVQRGEKIVDRGEIISSQTFLILNSLKKVSEKRSVELSERGVLAGQIIIVFVLFVLQFLYLWFFRPYIFQKKANVLFVLILITSFVLLTSILVRTTSLNVYIIPYAVLPILIRTFFDSRTALFAHIITVLMCSTIVDFPYEFLILQIAVGMTAVYSLRDLTQRSQLIFCSILVLLTYCVMYFGIALIQEGIMTRIKWRMFAYFMINGGLMLSSYLLIYLFEWMFGYTSNVTLVELSNINNPLLRTFSETCPGSFQHSMQVSNLATAAAQEINANVQLARTGALYHDIGKMSNPVYFVENQSGNNPHDNLSIEESAVIIANHVTDGLKIAQKNKLPVVIKDCIRTHHGNGPVRYFYNAFKIEHPDEEVPGTFFYKGKPPFSKETAILMMADAVEAASRSMKDYSEESITDLVEKIISMQVIDGSFKNVPITFRDLERIKSVFKAKLISIYHTRIEYPEAETIEQPLIKG